MYQPYLLIFEGALRKRAKLLVSNHRFNELVEAARVNPACEGLSLESFLVLPVQRIPRYKMLLDEVKKCTPLDHPDYADISVACETIKEVATENNEAFHIREAEEKLYKLMTLIEPPIDLLDTQTRRFIREADMQKQCRKGLKDYRFWLLNDALIYAVPNVTSGKYTLKQKLWLKDIKISRGNEAKFNGCDLIVQTSLKSFFCCLSSPAERDEWFNDYTKAAEKLQAHSTVAVAPIWRPDETSGLCSKCNAAFSLLFRKHHCRKCGLIVCANCSKDRVVIASLDHGRPVRVCVTCSARIAQGESVPSVAVSSPPHPPAAADALASPNSTRRTAAQAPPVPPPNRKPPTPQSIQAGRVQSLPSQSVPSQSVPSRVTETNLDPPVLPNSGEIASVTTAVSSVSLLKADASPVVEEVSASPSNSIGSTKVATAKQPTRPLAPTSPGNTSGTTAGPTKIAKVKWPPQRKAADSDDEVDAAAPVAASSSSKPPEVIPQRSIKDRWPPR